VKAEAKTRKSAAELQKLNVPGKSKILTELDVGKLKEFAQAFMEDSHEMCNVWLQESVLEEPQTQFNLALRRFRHANPWLQQNLDSSDRFNRIHNDHHTVFYGLRTEPDAATPHQVAMVVNMGGDPATVTLGDWLQINTENWRVAIASPTVSLGTGKDALRSFELSDSQGVLLEKVG
jgi:hypothetical protein